jgi:hypothetical protein
MPRDLQVTLRGGRLLTAYLYFNRDPKTAVAKTKREADGMIVDFNEAGTPIGIEFVAPSKVSLAGVNALLNALSQDPASADELWPLISASSHNAKVA